MSINYWNGLYKKNHVLLHSTFAGFCVLKMMLDAHIIEFGCGNGRDTFFLAQQGHRITGVDYACPYGKSHNPNFIKAIISFSI